MSERVTLPRIPLEVGGIQVNFCKNPLCGNFGVPASPKPQPKGPGAKNHPSRDTYTVVAQKKNIPSLCCEKCGEYPTLKSNQAIYEESKRLLEYLAPRNPQTTCPGSNCKNNNVEIDSYPFGYHRFGKTKSGSDRFRCKICGKVFAVSLPDPQKSSISRQTSHSYKNIDIFTLLVNKTPLTRICEIKGIQFRSLMQHIDFIHRQCLMFAGRREIVLRELDLGDRYLSVDRQDYVVNWSNQKDKRNIILHGIGSADMETSYIFGMHLDYDPHVDIESITAEATIAKEYLLPLPFQRYARLWLKADYEKAVKNARQPKRGASSSVVQKITETYEDAIDREDVEVSDVAAKTRKLPSKGAQTHSEYTIYGHFQFLKHVLAGARRIVFYMDQESGIRAACHAAFWESILEKKCEAFYVSVNKELTINEKRIMKQQGDKLLESFVDLNPHLQGLYLKDIRLFYLENTISSCVPYGPWKDEWLRYPFPDMSEPEKAVCWLTDIGDSSYANRELAELFLRATLHPIDRFFMQIRRRLSPLERSIPTASSSRRMWYAYAPYRPDLVVKLLDIYRVYYNFIKKGDDGKTPAMRLGLAKGAIRYEDIIYYK